MRIEPNRVVPSRRLAVYLTGIVLVAVAVSLFAAVGSIYSTTWNDFVQSIGVSVATVYGTTDTMGNGSDPGVNITMHAVYPKAVVESWQLFTANLTFFVTLDPSITTFAQQDAPAQIKSNSGYGDLYPYFWDLGLDRSNEGPIQPYETNISLPIVLVTWPPSAKGHASPMLDFTDKFEIYPTISLFFEWRSENFTGEGSYFLRHIINWGYLEVSFNLTDYQPISIYRFNYPSTLWVIYGYSIPTIVIMPIYLLYKRSKEGKPAQITS